ncbi:MAG TPA: type II toxin-antitoxin system RelE/ParE family toxin, partial [Methylocystis sp.]|nr:type II toxin-antitoxin system RelE/ParE family toxin [Methylocystis sp.]
MKVCFTAPALADLNDILSYIAARSPRGAQKVKSRVRYLIELLPAHPLLGTRTDEPGIRRLIATPYPYLIFYEAGNDEIIIHAVRHAARDPESMPG